MIGSSFINEQSRQSLTDMVTGQLTLDNSSTEALLSGDCSQGKPIAKTHHYRDWRNGSEVRTLVTLADDLGSIPQIHTVAQPSITPVTKDPIPSSDLLEHQAYMWHIHTYMQTKPDGYKHFFTVFGD